MKRVSIAIIVLFILSTGISAGPAHRMPLSPDNALNAAYLSYEVECRQATIAYQQNNDKKMYELSMFKAEKKLEDAKKTYEATH